MVISTASNVGSPLLRLPSELKDQIYELVLGGQLLHIYKKEGKISHHLCQEEISEIKTQEIFSTSEESWFSTAIEERHTACPGTPAKYYHGIYHRKKDSTQLDLALLSCCRQIYQEARPISFSTNTFSFTDAWGSDSISHSIFFSGIIPLTRVETQLFIRRLHLDIVIHLELDEESWNQRFRDIAKEFKSLQHFYIGIAQNPIEYSYVKTWQFKTPAECSFLGDLKTLRDLRLMTVTVTISDPHNFFSCWPMLTAENERQYRWTMSQKQEWAGYIRRVLLRQEDQEPATEEGS